MIYLTEEQAQKIEEALSRIADKRNIHFAGDAQVVAGEALATIRAARAQADHIAGAGKVIGCAYCDNPLFAGTKCNNCGRVTLAEQAEQEPVAQQDSDDRRLLREVLMLCEATEELEPTNEFMRGRIFEAKGIRRGIGTWYQDTFCGRSYMCEPVLNAAPVEPVKAEQEPVAFADKYGNVMKAKEKLTSTNVRDNWYDRPLYEKAAFDADLYSVAGKLALELECLLLDTKDLSVVSKWWDSAHDALEQWRTIKYAAPVRTKDLTEPLIDELRECRDLLMCVESCSRNNFENLAYERVQAIDAVIATDLEKNK